MISRLWVETSQRSFNFFCHLISWTRFKIGKTQLSLYRTVRRDSPFSHFNTDTPFVSLSAAVKPWPGAPNTWTWRHFVLLHFEFASGIGAFHIEWKRTRKVGEKWLPRFSIVLFTLGMKRNLSLLCGNRSTQMHYFSLFSSRAWCQNLVCELGFQNVLVMAMHLSHWNFLFHKKRSLHIYVTTNICVLIFRDFTTKDNI